MIDNLATSLTFKLAGFLIFPLMFISDRILGDNKKPLSIFCTIKLCAATLFGCSIVSVGVLYMSLTHNYT